VLEASGSFDKVLRDYDRQLGTDSGGAELTRRTQSEDRYEDHQVTITSLSAAELAVGSERAYKNSRPDLCRTRKNLDWIALLDESVETETTWGLNRPERKERRM